MIRPLSAEPPQDHKRLLKERFDCDLLCRAAGALDHMASRESGETAERTRRMADEVHAAAVWLRLNGRATP